MCTFYFSVNNNQRPNHMNKNNFTIDIPRRETKKYPNK